LKRPLLALLNFALFTLLALFLIALQTTLWLQLFGDLPAPHTWIPILVFWILYRPASQSLIMTYAVALVLASSTVLYLGSILLLCACIYLLIQAVKMRIYVPGSIFFMALCGLAGLTFPILSYLLSWILDPNPLSNPRVLSWILSTLLTMLLSLALYPLLTWLDRVSDKSSSTTLSDSLS